jgi:hypothetical protein
VQDHQDLQDKLERAVARVADKSPDAIYEMMRRRGITGRPGSTHNCPLAKLLHKEWGGRFVIGRKSIALVSGKSTVKVPTPKNMANFVRKFDLSGFPTLLAPPPRCLTERANAARRKRPSNSGPSGKHKYGPRVNHPAKDVGR